MALIASAANAAPGAGPRPPSVAADPGTVVRWTEPGTKRCAMGERSWAALGDTCYYPIDLLATGVIRIARFRGGSRERATVTVNPFPYPTEEIDLPDIPQANPSAEDLQRNARDQALVARVWRRKEGPARFELPLSPPLHPLPKAKSFGWRRVFNGRPASQPHTGVDYALPAGTPVVAVADGTVVLAAELFYAGNAVFIDHGDGLVTMSFHLSEINVPEGQEVRKGDRIGSVGKTGRATGPHLFFGVRWHGARVDPSHLLEDPARIPAVAP